MNHLQFTVFSSFLILCVIITYMNSVRIHRVRKRRDLFMSITADFLSATYLLADRPQPLIDAMTRARKAITITELRKD